MKEKSRARKDRQRVDPSEPSHGSFTEAWASVVDKGS